MTEKKIHSEEEEPDFSFKNFLIPLTTFKAINLIIILGFIIFFNGLFNNFLGDDYSQIIDNASIHSISNIRNFFAGSTFFNGGEQQFAGTYYKPLLSTFFSLIYTLFGSQSFFFHLFQLSMHLANASMLFVLFKKFFRKSLSLILSVVFLIHPINSESVFYISATQEVLFFFFGLIALNTLTHLKNLRSIFLSSFFLFLSILSKETGILFIIISILYILMFNKKKLYNFLGFLIPFIFLYFVLRINAIGIFTKPSNAPIAQLDLIQRMFNIPEIFCFYIKTFFFPVNLASSYHWAYKEINFNHFFLPLFICLILILFMFLFLRFVYKRFDKKIFNTYIFFSFWFIMGLGLHFQIVPLDATVAERWFYFPIVGLLGILAILIDVLKIKLSSKLSLLFIGVIILLLSYRTLVRSFDWRDQLTLATHDIKISKEAYNLENNIGYQLIRQGQFEKAKPHIERSIKLYPYLTNYNNLGLIYLGEGDYIRAKDAYLKALEFGDYSLTYENLAGLALAYGDPKENIIFIESALKKFPQNSRLWLYLAILEYRINMVEKAKTSISNAYAINKSGDIVYVYEKILNNQPLQLEFNIENKPLKNDF